jgi:hypothetical protein
MTASDHAGSMAESRRDRLRPAQVAGRPPAALPPIGDRRMTASDHAGSMAESRRDRLRPAQVAGRPPAALPPIGDRRMTASDHAGSMAESRAFAALSMHIEHAAGSTDTLKTILWMVGAHPQLLAHARVLSNLEDLLQTNTFLPDSLHWSSAWRDELNAWTRSKSSRTCCVSRRSVRRAKRSTSASCRARTYWSAASPRGSKAPWRVPAAAGARQPSKGWS